MQLPLLRTDRIECPYREVSSRVPSAADRRVHVRDGRDNRDMRSVPQVPGGGEDRRAPYTVRAAMILEDDKSMRIIYEAIGHPNYGKSGKHE